MYDWMGILNTDDHIKNNNLRTIETFMMWTVFLMDSFVKVIFDNLFFWNLEGML